MSEMKLLPCPFCGSTQITVDDWVTWYARCEGCGVKQIGLTKERAVENWNGRAAAPVVSGGGLSGSNRKGDLPTAGQDAAVLVSLLSQAYEDHQRGAAAPGVTLFDFMAKRVRAHQAATPDGLQWQTMDTAPRDGTPILGWCDHESDPYFEEPDAKGRSRLTLYGAHTEGFSHVANGPNIIVWGGAWDDRTHEYDGGSMPDWWFRADSEFEVTANPTAWMPLPAAPEGV